MEDILFDLYYSSVHRNEELEDTIEDQEETIHELQSVLKFRTNENKELYKENNRLKEVIKIKDDARIELVEENKKLKKCLTIADNDYKKCYAVNDLTDIVDELKKENNQLKSRNKMLTKIALNSIYGIHCCKNHCVYTDTDSIKSESEDK